jgi:hypothetical protein
MQELKSNGITNSPMLLLQPEDFRWLLEKLGARHCRAGASPVESDPFLCNMGV